MQSDRRLRAALWALMVASVCFAPSALAQYSGEAGGPGGGTSDLVNSGGTTDVVSRYNKATKGRSLTEWVKHLGDEDPVRRLDAVKSLGDSNDPDHFGSFASWRDAESMNTWKQRPEFAERFGDCRALCEETQDGNFETVRAI